jgi:hypothetical protein
MTAISEATQQEFIIVKSLIADQAERLRDHEQNMNILTETLTQQLSQTVSKNVTDTLM